MRCTSHAHTSARGFDRNRAVWIRRRASNGVRLPLVHKRDFVWSELCRLSFVSRQHVVCGLRGRTPSTQVLIIDPEDYRFSSVVVPHLQELTTITRFRKLAIYVMHTVCRHCKSTEKRIRNHWDLTRYLFLFVDSFFR